MKYKIALILTLIFGFSLNCFAQNKTAWIDALENDFKSGETWKLDIKSERSASDYYEYDFNLKNGAQIVNIQIQILKDSSNIEKRFAETVENLTNGMGRFSTRTKLKDLGDEAFIWINVNKNGWTMIRFRKSNVFVEIFSLSEEAARVFAKNVLERIP
ncbi:MAG: hypothetical protein ABWZ66_11605 [Pyrinomonadaceae bacterium]